MRGKSRGVPSLIAAASILGSANLLQADADMIGMTTGISFGVAPYGNPQNNGAPTYIANNFTGEVDILSSPGGGSLGAYQTANSVVANNLASYGPAFGPIWAFQNGGSNGNGTFGSAAAVNAGNVFGYNIADFNPGGGSASYLINSSITTWSDPDGTDIGESFGAWVTMGGNVSSVGSTDVVSLKIHVDSLNEDSPFFGGADMPELVLAISRNTNTFNNVNDYNIVTIGGIDGDDAGLIITDGAAGSFVAAAVNNLELTEAIPAGDIFTVYATLTAYADPASFESFDLIDYPNLLELTGPLPTNSFLSTNELPEPSAFFALTFAAAGALTRRKR